MSHRSCLLKTAQILAMEDLNCSQICQRSLAVILSLMPNRGDVTSASLNSSLIYSDFIP